MRRTSLQQHNTGCCCQVQAARVEGARTRTRTNALGRIFAGEPRNSVVDGHELAPVWLQRQIGRGIDYQPLELIRNGQATAKHGGGHSKVTLPSAPRWIPRLGNPVTCHLLAVGPLECTPPRVGGECSRRPSSNNTVRVCAHTSTRPRAPAALTPRQQPLHS